MTVELQQVAEQYRLERDSLTEKEKATRERALWAMTTPSQRKEGMRRDFLKKLIGEPANQTEARNILLGLGDAAQVLWDRIEKKKLLTTTGANIARDAKKISTQQNKSLSDAIIEALKEYDALPYERFVDGVPYRVDYVKRPTSQPEVGAPAFHQVDQVKDKEFWLNFRATLVSYLEKRSEGLDPSIRELLKRQFETDVKVVIDQFLNNIYREQKKHQAQSEIVSTAISRNVVSEACEALHMDPPKSGQPIDMALANRQKKLLARAYHPDSNGGDTTTQDKYIAVINAFQTLEAFSKQSHAGNPAHRGGDRT